MASEFTAELLKIPPVTRFLCAAQLAVSLPVMLKLVAPLHVLFIWQYIVQNFEIWRIVTSFFLGGSGINFIFEFVMLYRCSDALESNHYSRRSSDYAWQLLVAAGAIITLSRPLNAYVHNRPLLIALTYLSSKLSPPGTQSSIFGFITLPVVYYPYIMVAMDLVMGGPAAAAAGVVGLVVGHAWWWGIYDGAGGRGRFESWGKAPSWVKNFVSDGPAAVAGAGGTADAGGAAAAGPGPIGGVHVIAPRSRTGAGSSSSTTATGYQWGSGQRLGES